MKYLLLLIPFFFVSCGGKDSATKTLPKDLDSLVTMFPDSLELLIKRGNRSLKIYDFPKAMEDAAKAFRLDSNKIDIRLLYANVLNNRPERTIDEVMDARRHFKIVLSKEPKNTNALIGLASTFSLTQDFEKSFQYINEALKINPRYRDAYVMKGSNYLVLGQIDLAKSSYETAVQQDPKFYEAYLMLGSIYQAEKDPICIEYYTTAASLQPKNLDVLYALAYAKQVFGKEDEALPIYRKMIQLDNEYHEAIFQIGWIKQFSLDDVDSAIYYYNSAIKTEPRFVEAWHNLGLCYEEKGDKTNALKSYAKALKYDPNFTLSRDRANALR